MFSSAVPRFDSSENFTAVCNSLDSEENKSIPYTLVYIEDDSIRISTTITFQCCPKFELKISDITADIVYVQFSDTATMLCDCYCDYGINIVIGKAISTDKIIDFNGKRYEIQPADYQPLIQLNKTWNSINAIPGIDYTYATQIEHSITSAQGIYSCWNGKKYYKVNAQATSYYRNISKKDTIAQYIREENGKVYLLDQSKLAVDGCEEALIYDFTLEVGDTIMVGFDSTSYVVVPIQTPTIQGKRCLALADLSHPELSAYTIWIEGIGDTRGLFKSDRSLLIVGTYYTLTCCRYYDNLIYQNPEYPDCGVRPAYQFFLEEGKKWRSVVNCTLQDTTYIFEQKITSENFTNSTFSRRYYLHPNDKFIYIQENDGRIYYVDNRYKVMIYDFTLHSGDSVEVAGYDFNTITLYVDSVTYLQCEDEALRKTLYLSGNGKRIWVEGIGDISSPLGYWFPLPDNGCFTNFACCWKNDELLYRSKNYPDCANFCVPPTADFTYDILESYPIQIDLKSAAFNADSIIWKGVSKYSGLDTIIGTGEQFRIKDTSLFKIENLCASPLPCKMIKITQVTVNDCGYDSVSKHITFEPLSAKQKSYADVSLCPNPTKGTFNIVSSYPIQTLNYTFYNTVGYQVDKGTTNGIITTNLSNGIYFVVLRKDNSMIFRDKIIIKR